MDDNSGNIDQLLKEAYLNTRYQVLNPKLEIRIGSQNEELNVFLFDNHCWHWAFVSASNPGSKPLSAEENEKRHQKLLERVVQMGLRSCEGLGIPEEKEDWQTEKSLLILDITRDQAIELARSFSQLAIVFGDFQREAELLWVA